MSGSILTFTEISTMSQLPAATVQVPATTANLGPGFDCLGAALSLHNTFEFSLMPTPTQTAPTLKIEVEGLEANRVQCNAQNLVYQAFCYFFEQLRQPIPSLHLKICLGVPLARGLGSSATAIIGGLAGANALVGSPLNQSQLLDFAIALEGHPDNVAPALLGGCQLATLDETTQQWTVCPIQWTPEIVPIVAIPDFELSTQSARHVLPQQCSYTDAIFNIAHLGLLIKGLETGRGDWIQVALQDRLHQPHRTPLIPGFEQVRQAAIHAGAKGLVISGAGPTLLALSTPQEASAIALTLQTAWQEAGISAQASLLALDPQGAIVS
jgi:homoserine kinase